MNNTLTIAATVVKDAARRKIFYVVFLFALAIVALSPLLPSFEMGARTQFLRDISLSLTSLFAVVLAVIVSVSQVPVDIDRRTVYNVFSKPVSRTQYLLGKYMGILATLAIILLVMGLEIVLLIIFRLKVFTPVIFQGIAAVFLESAIIAAFCLALTTFTSIPVTSFAAVLFYLLCHVKTGFLYEKLVEGASGALKPLTWSLYYLIPNLENYNLSQPVGYGKGVSALLMLRIAGYAAIFVALFLIIGYLFFRRRDL